MRIFYITAIEIIALCLNISASLILKAWIDNNGRKYKESNDRIWGLVILRMLMRRCFASLRYATQSDLNLHKSLVEGHISLLASKLTDIEYRATEFDSRTLEIHNIKSRLSVLETDVAFLTAGQSCLEDAHASLASGKSRIEAIQATIAAEQACQGEEQKSQGRQIQIVKHMLATITSGLGRNFEKFNKAWLEAFLAAKGFPLAKVMMN